MTKHILPYNFNTCKCIFLPEPYWDERTWFARSIYNALNYLYMSARVNASDYYFTIVSSGKTAEKWVKAQ